MPSPSWLWPLLSSSSLLTSKHHYSLKTFLIIKTFLTHRVLRVPRILIHKNLFASLLLHCVSMIIFKVVIFLPSISNENPVNSQLNQVILIIHSFHNYHLNNPVSKIEHSWLQTFGDADQILSADQLHLDVLWRLLFAPTLGQHIWRGT